ncbi:MAG: hypothetical protein QOH27_3835 [Mycobacterium sp.]|jgi:hypothetical protein|nr:hypothetical protein [Mycobacterium sp.]MDT7757937.1 hypothetical protein [Mycobacterium sp.]
MNAAGDDVFDRMVHGLDLATSPVGPPVGRASLHSPAASTG